MSVLAHADNQIIDVKRQFLGETKVLNVSQGIVSAITSVTNVQDDVDDIILPGAYAKTLEKRKPKIVWSHSWELPVAKVLEAKELMPGDPDLPEKIQTLGGGGLYVKMQFNMETQTGRDAFSNVKFFDDESEWSIGYLVHPGEATIDKKTGIRKIKSLELFECSPVLFGAHPDTVTIDVKNAISSHKVGTSKDSWDEVKVLSNLTSNDEESYRKAFAWVDSDNDSETKDSYKFIHHFVSDDGVVGDASVEACLAEIDALNADGLSLSDADRKGIYEHLTEHLRDAQTEFPELKVFKDTHDFVGFSDHPEVCSECGDAKSAEFHNIEEKPYEVRKNGDQYCVYNSDTGKKVPGGCHDTRADANDHMSALYANVDKCLKDFTETLLGKTISAKCEKTLGHKDDCGFDYQESNMSVKETEPKTEAVVEPTEVAETVEPTEVKEETEVTTIEDGNSGDPVVPEVKEEVEPAAIETENQEIEEEKVYPEYFKTLLDSVNSFSESLKGLNGEESKETDHNVLIVNALQAQMDAFKSLLSVQVPEVETVEEPEPIKTLYTDTHKVLEFEDGRVEIVELSDEEKAEVIVNGIMRAGGVTTEPVDSDSKTDSSKKEEKIYVSMTGSFESVTQGIYQTLDENLPEPLNRGADQLCWIEATFPDSVLVCVTEYIVDASEDYEYEYMGSRYFSYPYTMDGDTITLGEPTEVEITAVLTPKDGEPSELEEKIVPAIEAKIGRTLSADNAEKIRKAVHSLVDVLVGAGIEMEEPKSVNKKSMYEALMMENELLQAISNQ
jgi:HK97 family phage prohead protease